MSPKKKKCDYSDVISAPVDQLLKMAPSNPAIRTQVHAEIKQAIPDNLQSYDEIVQWIEETYDPKLPFGADEAMDHTSILLKLQESGTCSRYTMGGAVRFDDHAFKIPLKDISRVFLKCNRERRTWTMFRAECAKVINELVLKQVQAETEKYLKLAEDHGVSWDEPEIEERRPGQTTIENVASDSSAFFDAVYYRLSAVYPDQIESMNRR